MPPHPLRDLARHAEWADSSLWSSLLASPAASSDSQALEWFHHIHRVQRAFLALWRAEAIEKTEPSDFADAPALAAWGREGHRAISEHLAAVAESELARVLEIPWARFVEPRIGRSAGPVTVEESIVQVAMHSAHHRGQVAARLRQVGGEPPLVDYIAWLWFERPDPGWPAPSVSSGSSGR